MKRNMNNVAQRTDDDINDDVMADGRTIGQARAQAAAESKARRAAEARARALHNAKMEKMIANRKAAEDDDITDEAAGKMRIQMAQESQERKAAEAAALKASNTENKRRIASMKAAYLTNAGAATGITAAGSPFAPDRLGYSTPPRTVPIKGKRSPSQQQQAKYYPKYGGSPTSVMGQDEQLW